MTPSVQIRKLESYDPELLAEAVKGMLSSLPASRLARSKRVLLKPNLLGAFPPQRAVTTHPRLLEALLRYFLELGKEVWIGDSPGGPGSVEKVWQACGLKDLAERYPVKLVNLSTSGFRELNHNGMAVKVSEVFWQCGTVINVGKLKTHGLMAYTGALKNLYGLIPGMAKTEYHRLYPNTRDFAALLLALYRSVKNRISYSIIDGILGMDGLGPSAGRPREFGLLLGSRSIPALDFTAARMMGFELDDVPYLREALHGDGILPSRIDLPTSFRQFRLPEVDIRAVKLSKDLLKFVPGGARKVFQRVYHFQPWISERCVKCGVCVASCPVEAISAATAEQRPRVNATRCIKCMCCHELCPHQAIDIKQSFLARMVSR